MWSCSCDSVTNWPHHCIKPVAALARCGSSEGHLEIRKSLAAISRTIEWVTQAAAAPGEFRGNEKCFIAIDLEWERSRTTIVEIADHALGVGSTEIQPDDKKDGGFPLCGFRLCSFRFR
jgi:hypothetical protein